MSLEVRYVLKMIWTVVSIICVTVVALPLAFCTLGSMVRSKSPEHAATEEHADPCEQDAFHLCRVESYLQDRIIASLQTSGTAVLADVYGRGWDSACLVLPYMSPDEMGTRCSPGFRCYDELRPVAELQHWAGNDSLWGLMLFSDCRFAMSARFQLRRLDFDFKSDTFVMFDRAQPTRIDVVKQTSVDAGEGPAYQVKLILGVDG